MNFSSSGLCALIGGPCVFFADDPPIERVDNPPTVASVAIASCKIQTESVRATIPECQRSARELMPGDL
jgi:hypothetical protein